MRRRSGSRVAVLAAAMSAVLGAHAREGKHANAPRLRTAPEGTRRRAARRKQRRAREHRFVRSQDRMEQLRRQLKKGELRPVHPRDRYWFARGLASQPFTLEPPTHGGGSYYARYRAMYEAGAAKRQAVA